MNDEHVLILTLASPGYTSSSISMHTVNSEEACHAAGKAWTKGLRNLDISSDSSFTHALLTAGQ